MFQIKYPTNQTLKKYGLTRDDFAAILNRQDCICPICLKEPKTGRWVIDHYHVLNYKKLPPEQRKLYVRGITCWFCNKYYLGRSISVLKAINVVNYLKRYEAVKPVKLKKKRNDEVRSNLPGDV